MVITHNSGNESGNILQLLSILLPFEKRHKVYEIACNCSFPSEENRRPGLRRITSLPDRSSTHADFGLNPEHPPLVKLLATAPLLWLPLKSPAFEERFFKEDAFLRGKEFLYQNDPEDSGAHARARSYGTRAREDD